MTYALLTSGAMATPDFTYIHFIIKEVIPMDDTKSTPSEMVAMMMLIRYYSASCLQLIDKIIVKLPPEVAFPQAFASKDTAPPPTSSATPVASSPPASPPAPAPTPPPAPPPVPAPTPQQPAAELVDPLPDTESATPLDFRDVRHRITLVAQSGHAEEIKGLLSQFGVSRLSGLEPSSYRAILEAAEALLHEKEGGNNGND